MLSAVLAGQTAIDDDAVAVAADGDATAAAAAAAAADDDDDDDGGGAQVPVRIVQVDSSQSTEAGVVDMQPEGLSPQEQMGLGPARVHLLYRPGRSGPPPA